jgi:hypothetical protein
MYQPTESGGALYHFDDSRFHMRPERMKLHGEVFAVVVEVLIVGQE